MHADVTGRRKGPGGLVRTLCAFLFPAVLLAACGGGGGGGTAAATYTVGGAVTGLTGSVTLVNGAEALAVSANGGFTFATALASGASYSVTVQAQPAGQTCTVTGGSGTIGSANITGVQVTCATNPASTWSVGGTVSGLSGSLTLKNGTEALPVATNGSFTFTSLLTTGTGYNVTVQTQPAGQTCTVTSGSGTMGTANVTSVQVACTNNPASTWSVGGTVSGLSGSLTLKNGTEALAVAVSGSFTFTSLLTTGAGYNVTVQTQPAGQTCTVTNGTGTMGTANVTSVQVACTNNPASNYSLGGTVSGANGALALQNGTEILSIAGNGSFTFATLLTSGTAYNVTVQAQPGGQTCTVTNGSGTMGSANVTNIQVACANNVANTYFLGGMVNGASSALTLADGTESLAVSANGAFTFPTPLATGAFYNVTVQAQPTGQTCTVTGGSGTMGTANVTTVRVACANNAASTWSVGGSVTGLSGTLTLLQNGGDALPVGGNGAFTFGTALATGAPYAVTVQTQPTGQTCTVTNGSGTMGTANVTNVQVACATNPAASYTLGGTVSGLTGTVVVANGAELLSVSASPFTFATPLATGTAYDVTVQTQPAGQTCTVTSGSGTMGTANVTNVQVACANNPPNTWSVGGTVTGLMSAAVLANGADTLTLSADGTFTFAVTLTTGTAYNVTVQTQPTGQICTIANGSGTMGTANVTNVQVTCPKPQLQLVAGDPALGGSADGFGGAATFSYPYGVALDAVGNAYVADSSNHTIREITTGGDVITFAGSAQLAGYFNDTGSVARFTFPYGVATDSAGNLYVADTFDSAIRKITPAGVVTTFAGAYPALPGSADGTGTAARFRYPYGVATDSADNVYVADTLNATIRKITTGGVVTTLAGTAGSVGSADGNGTAARFNNPRGIAVDASGNVYVADTDNHTIRKITSAGDVTTFAGTAGVSGATGGTGTAALFNAPTGLAADAAGNIYVADTGNYTIRKITSAGVVTTLAGTAGHFGFATGNLPGIIYAPHGVAVRGTTLYFSTGNAVAGIVNLP